MTTDDTSEDENIVYNDLDAAFPELYDGELYKFFDWDDWE